MFEDRHVFKFVCALLGFASIIMPGPIIPLVSLVIVIGMLIYKIRRAKESPEGFESLMLDIVIIVIVIVIDIGFFAMRIAIENDYDKYHYTSSSSSQEYSLSDLADMAIQTYKMGHLAQFDGKTNVNTIKNGFKNFLEEEMVMADISISGNKVVCKIGTQQIIFTVSKNDIKYTVK